MAIIMQIMIRTQANFWSANNISRLASARNRTRTKSLDSWKRKKEKEKKKKKSVCVCGGGGGGGEEGIVMAAQPCRA